MQDRFLTLLKNIYKIITKSYSWFRVINFVDPEQTTCLSRAIQSLDPDMRLIVRFYFYLKKRVLKAAAVNKFLVSFNVFITVDYLAVRLEQSFLAFKKFLFTYFGTMQLIIFNVIFLYSNFFNIWKLEFRASVNHNVFQVFDIGFKNYKLWRFYLESYIIVPLRTIYWKICCSIWLLNTLPWKVKNPAHSLHVALHERTTYPYSWLRVSDVCNILHTNTNFMRIVVEKQQLADLELKANMPLYLHTTDTTHIVGSFTNSFCVELEPYYYKLLFHCLSVELARDPLVYTRFIYDLDYRAAFFKQVSIEFMALAYYRLQDVPFIETFTQKYSLTFELEEKLRNHRIKSEQKQNNFVNFIDGIIYNYHLIYTIVIEHFIFYWIVVSAPIRWNNFIHLGDTHPLLRGIEPVLAIQLPHLAMASFLFAWAYFTIVVSKYSSDEVYVYPSFYMKFRYFCLNELAIDIENDDADIAVLILFFGVTPSYFALAFLRRNPADFRRQLVLKGPTLPSHAQGSIAEKEPVYGESPILFFLHREDNKNCYYRTNLNNRGLLKHYHGRNSILVIDDVIPDVLDLYPARQIAATRYYKAIEGVEVNRFEAKGDIFHRTCTSPMAGSYGFLTHMGGRDALDLLKHETYESIIFGQGGFLGRDPVNQLEAEKQKLFLWVMDELDNYNKRLKNDPYPEITTGAFLYKTYSTISSRLALLNVYESLLKTGNIIESDNFLTEHDRVVSIYEVLYGSRHLFQPYKNGLDIHKGEQRLMELATKDYPSHIIRQRGQCMFYKDLVHTGMSRSPYIPWFRGLVNIRRMKTDCNMYYAPYMTDVIASLTADDKQYASWREIIGVIYKDLKYNIAEFMPFVDLPVAADPNDYTVPYSDLFRSLKERPHATILELLHNDMYDFQLLTNTYLKREDEYSKFSWLRNIDARSILERRTGGRGGYYFSRRKARLKHDWRRRLDSTIPVQPPYMANVATSFHESAVIPRQSRGIYRLNNFFNIREHGKMLNFRPRIVPPGIYSDIFDFRLTVLPNIKYKLKYVSNYASSPYLEYKRKLFYTPLTDEKAIFVHDKRIGKLLADFYADYYKFYKYNNKFYKTVSELAIAAQHRFNYDRDAAHDGMMDFAVFKCLKEFGVPGEDMYKQGIAAMIRRWGEKDPFIKAIQELHDVVRLDGYIELDPNIEPELNEKLKPFNLTVRDMHKMSFSEFCEFLDLHRVPNWLKEANKLEQVYNNDFDFVEYFDRSVKSFRTRVFFDLRVKQPPVAYYTLQDEENVLSNKLVTWLDQPIEAVMPSTIGDIKVDLMDKEWFPATDDLPNKIYCEPLRHLRLTGVYDPIDSLYHKRRTDEANMVWFTNFLVDNFPPYVVERIFRYFKLEHIPYKVWAAFYDLGPHFLLTRLEKHFSLARQLAYIRHIEGKNLCSHEVIEYCELFKFLEKIDTMLPRLLVGFTKNDDETDLTYGTFETYRNQRNPIISQYRLQNMGADNLYNHQQTAYVVYAPFTVEELALFAEKYETALGPQNYTSESEEIFYYVNKIYLRNINLRDSIKRHRKWRHYTRNWMLPEYFEVNSLFPTRDSLIVKNNKIEQCEHSSEIRSYVREQNRLSMFRRNPYRQLVFGSSRYKRRMWASTNLAQRMRLSRRFKDVIKQTQYLLSNEKFDETGHMVPDFGSRTFDPFYLRRHYDENPFGGAFLADKGGVNLTLVNYHMQNNVAAFPDMPRRTVGRHTAMQTEDARRWQYVTNAQLKNVYATYLYDRATSKLDPCIYNPFEMKYVQFPQIINTNIKFSALDRKIFDLRYKRFLTSFSQTRNTWDWTPKSNNQIFLDFRGLETLDPRDWSSVLALDPQNYNNWKAKTKRKWVMVDYIDPLREARATTPQLVEYEHSLDAPKMRKMVRLSDLYERLGVIYKLFVFNPRVRVLGQFVFEMPQLEMWFPEINGAFVKRIVYNRDVIVLEDLLYVLMALNNNIEHAKLCTASFADYSKAVDVTFKKPHLALIRRIIKQQVYPQEIVRTLALNNLQFAERVIRLRRILKHEYNVNLRLLDIALRNIIPNKPDKTVIEQLAAQLADYSSMQLKFWYIGYLQVVPRFIYAARDEKFLENSIKENLQAIRAGKQFYFTSAADCRIFAWLYLRKNNIIEGPIGRFTDPIEKLNLLLRRKAPRTAVPSSNILVFASGDARIKYERYRDFIYQTSRVKSTTHLFDRVLIKSILNRTASRRSIVEWIKSFELSSIPRHIVNRVQYYVVMNEQVQEAEQYLQYKLHRLKTIHNDIVSSNPARQIQGKVALAQLRKQYKYHISSSKKRAPTWYFTDGALPIDYAEVNELDRRRRLLRKSHRQRSEYMMTLSNDLTHAGKMPNRPRYRRREDMFVYQSLNQQSDYSLQHIIDEVILTGFYSLSGPKLAEKYHQHLLASCCAFSLGKPDYGVFLNWTHGRPAYTWFALYNNQTGSLTLGASGMIFLPRLTSYIDKNNIIASSMPYPGLESNNPDTIGKKKVSAPFLSYKTAFSFVNWGAKMQEREIWLHFFIYENLGLLPGDILYDAIFSFLLYHVCIWSAFFE